MKEQRHLGIEFENMYSQFITAHKDTRSTATCKTDCKSSFNITGSKDLGLQIRCNASSEQTRLM